jgi:hypothetical protein
MAGRYLRITVGSMVLLGLALAASCGKSGEDDSASAAPPPQPVKPARDGEGSDTGERKRAFADATLLVQLSVTDSRYGARAAVVQTHVTLADDALFVVETPSGAAGGEDDRVKLSATLSADERAAVEQSIRDLGLLHTGSVKASKTPTGDYRHVAISARLRLDDREHSFSLAGVSEVGGEATAFAELGGYRGVLRLVDELRAIASMKKAGSP